jgi:hypothetical protein
MKRMLRILEISWLVILLVSLAFGTWRWFSEGFSCAIWFYIVTIISSVAYAVRRKQRLATEREMEQQS